MLEDGRRLALILAVLISVASLVLAPVLIARLPADYFLDHEESGEAVRGRHSLVLRVVRNLLGMLLVLAGLAMLVLPGQGLLTLVAGMVLLEFPGKRRVELALIRRPGVRRTLNWVRARAGQGPLQTPGD